MYSLWLYILITLPLFPLITSSASFCKDQNNEIRTDNATAWLDDFVYFHQYFENIDIVKPSGNLFGKQNFTWCCVEAVLQYLRNDCTNTSSVKVDEAVLDPKREFPCGAAFQGDLIGVPSVNVSYVWASSHCPGWQLSRASIVTQWLETLVGFLLPSVVFSLNVPRGRKFPLPDRFFARGPWYQVVPFAILAVISATVDTITWLCIIFAMAGPVLLSGIYEAMLDYNVISYLQDNDANPLRKNSNDTDKELLPLAFRARILFSVLAGNLEISTAWKHVMLLAKNLDELDNPDMQIGGLSTDNPPPSGYAKPDTFRSRINSFDFVEDDPLHSELIPNDLAITTRTLQGFLPSYVEGSDRQDVVFLDGQATARRRSYSLSKYGRTLRQTAELTRIRSSEGSASTIDEEFSPPSDKMPSQQVSQSSSEDSHVIKSPQLADEPLIQLNSVRRRSQASRDPTNNTQMQLLIYEAFKEYQENDKRAKRMRRTAGRTDARLKAMLACQYSFGSTVGAPIVFYVGAFIYTLVEILQTYGDNDVAHALAFASWWMIIPHIATVSGFLLGGNNPNTLSVIVGAMKGSNLRYAFGFRKPNSAKHLDEEDEYTSMLRRYHDKFDSFHESTKHHIHSLLKEVYESSIYMPVSMWDRGRSKQDWLLVLCADTRFSYDDNQLHAELENFLGTTVMLSSKSMAVVIIGTFLLLFIPCMLGWLVAYLTPQVGLSCRSLTFTVYMSAQALMLVLWSIQITWGNKNWRCGRQIKRKLHAERYFDVLHSQGRQDVNFKGARKSFSPKWSILYRCFMLIGSSVAVFSAIGGTLLQIMGVYRNSLCYINARDWSPSRRDHAYMIISTNNRWDILEARRNWVVVGAIGIGFLATMGYAGWWYQNRTRVNFNTVALRLGQDIERRVEQLNPDASS